MLCILNMDQTGGGEGDKHGLVHDLPVKVRLPAYFEGNGR